MVMKRYERKGRRQKKVRNGRGSTKMDGNEDEQEEGAKERRGAREKSGSIEETECPATQEEQKRLTSTQTRYAPLSIQPYPYPPPRSHLAVSSLTKRDVRLRAAGSSTTTEPNLGVERWMRRCGSIETHRRNHPM